MSINHWLNIDYMSFLAADIAATARACFEDQMNMRGEVSISRVEWEGGCLSDTLSESLGISAWSV